MIFIPNLELYSVREDRVQSKAGLNWCFADAHVNTEDAYIALTTEFFRNNPHFFPLQGSIINVTWDDGRTMKCLLEGTQKINREIYPKQISSYNDKSVIGHYLRNRLGVTPTKLITMDDLNNYGRNFISVSYKGGNNYYFDFSN